MSIPKASFFSNEAFLYIYDMTVPIEIISVTWPTDNSGGEKTSMHPAVILECLKEQDSDDDLFTDSEGKTYWIDDLIGHEVEVNGVVLIP